MFFLWIYLKAIWKALSLNSLILGDNSTFIVKILKTENVGILKKLIKKESSSLGNIDANNLKLWDISFPREDHRSSIHRPTEPELKNTTSLSELFQQGLGIKCVHVVVDLLESKYNIDWFDFPNILSFLTGQPRSKQHRLSSDQAEAEE